MVRNPNLHIWSRPTYSHYVLWNLGYRFPNIISQTPKHQGSSNSHSRTKLISIITVSDLPNKEAVSLPLSLPESNDFVLSSFECKQAKILCLVCTNVPSLSRVYIIEHKSTLSVPSVFLWWIVLCVKRHEAVQNHQSTLHGVKWTRF